MIPQNELALDGRIRVMFRGLAKNRPGIANPDTDNTERLTHWYHE